MLALAAPACTGSRAAAPSASTAAGQPGALPGAGTPAAIPSSIAFVSLEGPLWVAAQHAVLFSDVVEAERAGRRHLPLRSGGALVRAAPLPRRAGDTDQHQRAGAGPVRRAGGLRAFQRARGPNRRRRNAHRAGGPLAAGPGRRAAERAQRPGRAARRQHLLHRHRLGRPSGRHARADRRLPHPAQRPRRARAGDDQAERHRPVTRRRDPVRRQRHAGQALEAACRSLGRDRRARAVHRRHRP